MCIAAFGFGPIAGFRLAFAANRDELHVRPTARAAWWDEAPSVLGGRDLTAGGSWLGIDRRGRLSIVGRSKEIIVTAGGKNVYPDELEELYGRCPNVLELSVVGLPDGNGNERVACLVHPDIADDATIETVAEVRNESTEETHVELVPLRELGALARAGKIDHALVLAVAYLYELSERE